MRKKFNVIVLVHTEDDITIADMKVVDAFQVTTAESFGDMMLRLEERAFDEHGPCQVYVQDTPM